MKILTERIPAHRVQTGLLVLALPAGEPPPDVVAVDQASGGRLLAEARQRTDDPTRRGSVFVFQGHGLLAAEAVALVGTGNDDPTAAPTWRRLGGQATTLARSHRLSRVAVSLAVAPSGVPRTNAAGAVAEGVLLGLAGVRSRRSKPEPTGPEELLLVGVGHGPAVERVLERARVVGESTWLARELISMPASELPPAEFARRAQAAGKPVGLEVRIHGEPELRRLGMNAILAVGRGSEHPPCLIELIYRGGGKRRRPLGARHLAFVGKGITFDSGGLSLKTPSGMEIQKRDMAGGAAVLGAMVAIARLGLPLDVRGLIPAAENMPDGRAYRPGDILTIFGGKTVEVRNTDAEGRLVLADALAWAAAGAGDPEKPRFVVDLATLTGAVSIALGREVAALLGTDRGLVEDLLEIGRETDERSWELPLVDEYLPGLRSDIADLKNVGDGGAGTIFGGLFLREFTGGLPWAHLDIAGVAWADKARTGTPRGAAGFGVRTLIALAERAANRRRRPATGAGLSSPRAAKASSRGPSGRQR